MNAWIKRAMIDKYYSMKLEWYKTKEIIRNWDLVVVQTPFERVILQVRPHLGIHLLIWNTQEAIQLLVQMKTRNSGTCLTGKQRKNCKEVGLSIGIVLLIWIQTSSYKIMDQRNRLIISYFQNDSLYSFTIRSQTSQSSTKEINWMTIFLRVEYHPSNSMFKHHKSSTNQRGWLEILGKALSKILQASLKHLGLVSMLINS